MAFCKMGHPWSILCPPFCTYRSGWFVPRHTIRIRLHSFSLNFERNSRDDEMTCSSKIIICAKLASGLLTMFLLRDNSLLFKCFISKFEIFLMTIVQLSDSILLSEGFSTVQTRELTTPSYLWIDIANRDFPSFKGVKPHSYLCTILGAITDLNSGGLEWNASLHGLQCLLILHTHVMPLVSTMQVHWNLGLMKCKSWLAGLDQFLPTPPHPFYS